MVMTGDNNPALVGGTQKKEVEVRVEKTVSDIKDQLGLAGDKIAEGGSHFPGMTYEEGVDAALRWVTGQTEDLPLDPADIEAMNG